ncbi:MAG: nucleoside deaminase [Candidatus Susulua stagnicola]|nr:nucleoside deaminase [Candidatus Susulua stagnicola]
MKNKLNSKYMQLAIKKASKNLQKLDGGPFGACIVKKNKVLAVARNTVLKDNDSSAHAEVNAIRQASKVLKSFNLSGCTIYTTTEPCPMCFSAIHWSRINIMVYGTNIADAKKRGFNELAISSAKMKALGKSKIEIHHRYLRKECLEIFKDWDKLNKKILY